MSSPPSGALQLDGSAATRLMEFTVAGNTVTIASRFAHLTRRHGGVDILLTDAMRQALDPRFALRQLPAGAIRGISEPAITFAEDGFDA